MGGGGRYPFSETLFGGGDPVQQAVADMLLIEEGGFPPPVGRLNYEKADNKQPRVFILKDDPRCWRVYFHVRPKSKEIIYVHAVCKKKNKRASKDTQIARGRIKTVLERRAAVTRFAFPQR